MQSVSSDAWVATAISVFVCKGECVSDRAAEAGNVPAVELLWNRREAALPIIPPVGNHRQPRPISEFGF